LQQPGVAPDVLINTQNVFTLDLEGKSRFPTPGPSPYIAPHTGSLVLVQPMLRACRRVLTSKNGYGAMKQLSFSTPHPFAELVAAAFVDPL
jgi:hypothetical protein